VVVIGAGNVGCDVATEAYRLGAKEVTLVDVQKPASFGKEREAAQKAGARFMWPVTTEAITRKGVVLSTGEVVPADTVVVSIGDKPDHGFLPATLDTSGGFIKVNEEYRTTDMNVFAIGDSVRPGLITDAIGAGRKVAESIDAAFTGAEESHDRLQVMDPARVRLEYYDPTAREFPDIRACSTACASCGDCRDCGLCESICPQQAISRRSLQEGRYEYVVDGERCIGCGFCAGACPCGIWSMKENDPSYSIEGVRQRGSAHNQSMEDGCMFNCKTKSDVLKAVKEYDISFIQFWFTDVLGRLKSFQITPSELDEGIDEGMGFDGSSIEGFARIHESDMIAKPDLTTFQMLPWRPAEKPVARMFCDILNPDGTPYEGDTRYALKRVLKKAVKMGYTAYLGPELEYFYFANSTCPEIIDRGGYFDGLPIDLGTDLRRETLFALQKRGSRGEYSHHEVAPSQHEIDLRYAEALKMADIVMTYRTAVKEIARQKGVYATFMPTPLFGENGSGMHVHQSLFKATRTHFSTSRTSTTSPRSGKGTSPASSGTHGSLWPSPTSG
jgi:Fe-S-cluster-containing hydrogenase component 2